MALAEVCPTCASAGGGRGPMIACPRLLMVDEEMVDEEMVYVVYGDGGLRHGPAGAGASSRPPRPSPMVGRAAGRAG